MASSSEKITALRARMKARGVDGYIVPLADEFQGEFLPDCAQRLQFLTGFTGSGGAAIVLEDKACAFTDGRYMLQIAGQVERSLYDIADFTKIPLGEWLAENAGKGAVIGYDPKLHTPDQVGTMAEKAPEITLKPLAGNLIDEIWGDRPAAPQGAVSLFPDDIAGRSAGEKLALIAAELKSVKADAALITMPDSVCWLLNVRGADVEQVPLVLCYALVHSDARAAWFVDSAKVPAAVRGALGDKVAIMPLESIGEALKTLSGKTVLMDERRSAIWFKTALEAAGAKILNARDPCAWPKACKTAAEIKSIKDVHIKDGVALAKFLRWLDSEAPKGNLTELDVAEKILACRAQDPAFQGVSFSTIAGFGPHGAIIHYRADEASNANIKPGNLLLVDSGGQYHYGTTDITRTIAIGAPSAEMRAHFTLVLRGHIALARARFAKGTTGAELDKLARGPLQAEGLDYAHGTGHGVGCYLGVHEEAANISPRGKDALEAGMLISNEPGYYKESAYGIRIENLILCVESGEGLAFETVSLAPIDRALIASDMLDKAEREWLNDYHARVYATLSPLLDSETANWLEKQTCAI